MTLSRDLSWLPHTGDIGDRIVFFDAEGAWCWSTENEWRGSTSSRPLWRSDPDGTITQIMGPPTDWEPIVARLRFEPMTEYVNVATKIAKETRDVDGLYGTLLAQGAAR